MPDTILRVSGATAKIRRLLRQTKLTPVAIYWRGEPIHSHKPDGKRCETSGCNFLLSSYDGTSFSTRVRLVTKFLREHRAELLAIKELGLLPPLIDFGLYDDTPPGRMWPRYRLPASCLQLVSEFRFEVELSFYGRRNDDMAWLMTAEGDPVDAETAEMNSLAVTAARYLEAYRLAVTLNDGTTQDIDFSPILQQFGPNDYRAIYRQPEHFRAFAIENGNLVWGEDWDLIFPVWKLHQNRLTVAVH